MKLTEVCLRAGNQDVMIRRTSWPDIVIWMIRTDPISKSRFFAQHVVGLRGMRSAGASPDDIIADDWEIIEEEKPCK